MDPFLPAEKGTKNDDLDVICIPACKEGLISYETEPSSKAAGTQNKKKDVPLIFKISVAVLGVLPVILLIILLVLVCEWCNIRDRAIQRHESTICVPWKSMGNCPGDLTAEGELCCGRTNRVIIALINSSTVYTFRENSGARMLNESCAQSGEAVRGVPIAKLVDLDMSKIQQQGEGTSIFWNTSHPDTILSGVEHNHGCIRILNPGFYFVYSHVSLHKNTTNTKQTTSTSAPHSTDGADPFFSHTLYRRSQTHGRKKLIESSKSECDTMTDENTLTSFTGSVFSLHEGDILSVETSHPQHLMKSGSNYFELYEI